MKVITTERDGLAERAGVRAGDELVEIDGRRVNDAIDVAYALGWTDEEDVEFVFLRGTRRTPVLLPARDPDELGLDLERDRVRTCGNRCMFCFVDQLPRGLRPALYVKDEDYRLSFTCGNYVTLTNLEGADYERILAMRLSPLYVSVHATDDAVRREMLGNPSAPPILDALRRLARAGIRLHAQIVVCPGLNDGETLEATLSDLAALGDALASVAVVPVGLTAHRDGLRELSPVDPSNARKIVRAVAIWQQTMLDRRGDRVFYAADEIHLTAGLDVPSFDEYGDFPQIENGVGLLRWFERETTESAERLRGVDAGGLRVAVLSGTLAAPFIERTLDDALREVVGLTVTVVAVENRFLGPSVTVAGLLSGDDLSREARAALDAPDAPDLVLIPAEAFNADGLTLDGLSLDAIRAAAGTSRIEASSDVVASIEDFMTRRTRPPEGGASSVPGSEVEDA